MGLDIPEATDDKDIDFKPDSAGLTPEPDPAEPAGDVEEDVQEQGVQGDAKEEAEDDEAEEEDEVKLAVKESNSLPEGFIEWEAVSDPTCLVVSR